MSTNTCPCESGRPLDRCCGPLLDGDQAADTAEALMRSRYSAHVLHRPAYLRDTWHPSTRPADTGTDPGVRWLGLRIVATRDGRPGDTQGIVEFVARWKVGGRAHRLHETSRFRFEDGRWWYVDGDVERR